MKERLRQLAREAVIFGLLGLTIGLVGGTWESYEAPLPPQKPVKSDMSTAEPIPPPSGYTLDKPNSSSPATPLFVIPDDSLNKVAVRLKNGRLVSGPKSNVGQLLKENPGAQIEVWGADVAFDPLARLGVAAQPVPIPADATFASPVPSQSEYRRNIFHALINALGEGLIIGFVGGFPLGLGVWIFYRVVRFAVKG